MTLKAEFKDRKVWIDATGILRWGPQPCTGVQRVELGLIDYALENPDRVGLCVLDATTRRYIIAEKRDLAYLRQISRVNRFGAQADKKSRMENLGTQLIYADQESVRRLATEFANTQSRSGMAYRTIKTLLRLTLWGFGIIRFMRFAMGKAASLARGYEHPADSDRKPFILVSHEVNRTSRIAQAVKQCRCREANIIYDLIPVRLPQFTSHRFTKKMGALLERILKTPTQIITISKATHDDLADWARSEYGIAQTDFIHTCRLNSSIASKPKDDVPIASLQGKRFALMCSTMDIRKGQWLLVAAWARLSKIIPSEDLPDLVLIGRKGNGWADLERELDAASTIAHKIHVLHGVNDASLQWAYRHADFCLFPSVAEGWGLGVSEALAHGKPVVHSDIPILHEAAQGLMPSAKPQDVNAWTEILANLLTTPGQLEKLTETARHDYQPGEPDDFARNVVGFLSKKFEAGFQAPGQNFGMRDTADRH